MVTARQYGTNTHCSGSWASHKFCSPPVVCAYFEWFASAAFRSGFSSSLASALCVRRPICSRHWRCVPPPPRAPDQKSELTASSIVVSPSCLIKRAVKKTTQLCSTIHSVSVTRTFPVVESATSTWWRRTFVTRASARARTARVFCSRRSACCALAPLDSESGGHGHCGVASAAAGAPPPSEGARAKATRLQPLTSVARARSHVSVAAALVGSSGTLFSLFPPIVAITARSLSALAKTWENDRVPIAGRRVSACSISRGSSMPTSPRCAAAAPLSRCSARAPIASIARCTHLQRRVEGGGVRRGRRGGAARRSGQ